MATILHEIGHALGLYHEHTRTDRDDYVRINWENVIYSYLYQFEKDSGRYTTTQGLDYDYGSIMHYQKHVSMNESE